MSGTSFFGDLIRGLKKGVQVLFILLFLYMLMTLVLGLLPVNKDFTHAADGIEIFVMTNQVHTDIIMPVSNAHIDWREYVPTAHFRSVDPSFRYISIGWGDKGFYINTPQWSDLTLGTALKALFLPSQTAMHTTYFRHVPAHDPDYVRLQISPEQYQELISYIIPYFKTSSDGSFMLIEGAGYSSNDNFYEAFDHYHLFNTSNNWTNRGLKEAGIRAAVWSPLDRAIMYQLRKIE